MSFEYGQGQDTRKSNLLVAGVLGLTSFDGVFVKIFRVVDPARMPGVKLFDFFERSNGFRRKRSIGLLDVYVPFSETSPYLEPIELWHPNRLPAPIAALVFEDATTRRENPVSEAGFVVETQTIIASGLAGAGICAAAKTPTMQPRGSPDARAVSQD